MVADYGRDSARGGSFDTNKVPGRRTIHSHNDRHPTDCFAADSFSLACCASVVGMAGLLKRFTSLTPLPYNVFRPQPTRLVELVPFNIKKPKELYDVKVGADGLILPGKSNDLRGMNGLYCLTMGVDLLEFVADTDFQTFVMPEGPSAHSLLRDCLCADCAAMS
jgi:hypothetical protein